MGGIRNEQKWLNRNDSYDSSGSNQLKFKKLLDFLMDTKIIDKLREPNILNVRAK